MSKKQTVGNRQQSGQDKEIYGEVLRSSREITPLTPGRLENNTPERDRLHLGLSERISVDRPSIENLTLHSSIHSLLQRRQYMSYVVLKI